MVKWLTALVAFLALSLAALETSFSADTARADETVSEAGKGSWLLRPDRAKDHARSNQEDGRIVDGQMGQSR